MWEKTEFLILKKQDVRLWIVITSLTERIRKIFCEHDAELSSSVIYAEFLDQKIDYQLVRYVKLVYLLSVGFYWSQWALNANTPTNSTRSPPQTQMGISSSILQVTAVQTDRQTYLQTIHPSYHISVQTSVWIIFPAVWGIKFFRLTIYIFISYLIGNTFFIY